MPDQRPRLIVSESTEKSPILIIDQKGDIAGAIIPKLISHYNIILVTGKEMTPHGNLTQIHFGKKIPMIPDENYSLMITIFNGEQTITDILPVISKKAKSLGAKSIFITSLLYADKKLKKLLTRDVLSDTTEVIYGEIFAKEEIEINKFTSFIRQIRTRRKLDIPGNGLQKTYPILFDDLCDAIITILFSQPPKTKTIYILPKHGFTQLAIARAFQKYDPGISINFIKQKNHDLEYELPAGAEYFFSTYNLSEKLQNIDLTPVPQDAKQSAAKPQSKRKKFRAPKISKPSNKWLLLLLCIAYFLLPLLLEFLFFIGGSIMLIQSIKSLQDNNIPQAQKYNYFAEAGFNASLFLGQNISGINPLLLIQKEPIMQKAQIGLTLAEIEGDTLDSINLLKTISDEKTFDPKGDFLQVVAKTKNSLASLQRLKAEGGLPGEISEKLNALQKPIALLENTIDTLPDLLGFYQNKKYLILFQNNMELRPGGGFIGSFATVEIRNGKIGKFEIRDIYDADGKLSAHIEPFFALRRYLGVSHLFLRDSNFDVDFVENAARAQKFLELETGEKVNGVIAIDISFVKKLIELFGPLDIYDFKETVTGDNFYLLTQTHAEKDFFPGSTQKKDFLRAVFNALDSKLTQNPKIPFTQFAQKIGEAISQKHLLIAIPNTESQTIFTVNNLSGSLTDNRQKKDNAFLDFLCINEANLGMNKANYYLKRSIEQKVNILDNGGVNEKTTLTYENTSKKDSVFGGDYKNYLRFILPGNAILQSVEVNGTTIPITNAVTDANKYTAKDFRPPQQLEVEKTLENGKAIYGFLTIIPIGTSQQISINYTIAKPYNLSKGVIFYDLTVFKQPGTDSDNYSFSITYPKEFQAIKPASDFTNVGGKYLYSGTLSEDKNLTLKFSRK